MNLNKTMIIGRVGKDPESNNGAVKFSVAVSQKYKDNEHTEWFNCVAFSKTGELVSNYIKKGQLVYVEGKTKTNEHEGKRYVSLLVNQVQLLEKKDKDPFDV